MLNRYSYKSYRILGIGKRHVRPGEIRSLEHVGLTVKYAALMVKYAALMVKYAEVASRYALSSMTIATVRKLVRWRNACAQPRSSQLPTSSLPLPAAG